MNNKRKMKKKKKGSMKNQRSQKTSPNNTVLPGLDISQQFFREAVASWQVICGWSPKVRRLLPRPNKS
jgi:hypothetical protein